MNHAAVENRKAGDYRFGWKGRKYRRVGMKGFVGDIADGNQVIGGEITDISTGGFRLSGIPEFFKAEKHTYATVISGRGNHYRLLAKPCWCKTGRGRTVEIGFKIIDAPWEWLEMTMREIPECDYEEEFYGFH